MKHVAHTAHPSFVAFFTVLINPDIYLLDEPTNHLSESAVKYFTDYLLTLTHQTVLTVSHDTTFLENTSTDVIHYEQRDVWGPYRKLVHYKGKMSHFVELQPQAKHYFQLATTDLKFNFPDPGRLEGIRTTTQKFLEMENVDFKYPGQARNQLTGVTLKMTLSTRAVLLGANGAGKTVRKWPAYFACTAEEYISWTISLLTIPFALTKRLW